MEVSVEEAVVVEIAEVVLEEVAGVAEVAVAGLAIHPIRKPSVAESRSQ